MFNNIIEFIKIIGLFFYCFFTVVGFAALLAIIAGELHGTKD